MQQETREALTERCDYLYRRAGVGVGASLLLSLVLSLLLWQARPPELVAFWQALMIVLAATLWLLARAYRRAAEPSTSNVEATALHPPSIASLTMFSGSK